MKKMIFGLLVSLVAGSAVAGPIMKEGDVIYECPVHGGVASASKAFTYSGVVPVNKGLLIKAAEIRLGILQYYSSLPFTGKTYYRDRFLNRYKVMIVDKVGNPTYTDEYYDGVIPCLNGVPQDGDN